LAGKTRRFLKHGMCDINKFMEYVIMSEGCWGWNGFTTGIGYGQFSGRKGNVTAHRFAYSYWNGEIPKGMLVRHTCDNPICSNPAHLIIGTARQNQEDRACKNGNGPGKTKPTREELKELYILWKEGNNLARKLSEKYHCHANKLLRAVMENKWGSSECYEKELLV